MRFNTIKIFKKNHKISKVSEKNKKKGAYLLLGVHKIEGWDGGDAKCFAVLNSEVLCVIGAIEILP